MHSIPALCLSCIQIEAVDYGDCASLELYYFINSDCWNTFSKSSSRHIQTFKIPWSCALEGKFIEKNHALCFKN